MFHHSRTQISQTKEHQPIVSCYLLISLKYTAHSSTNKRFDTLTHTDQTVTSKASFFNPYNLSKDTQCCWFCRWWWWWV